MVTPLICFKESVTKATPSESIQTSSLTSLPLEVLWKAVNSVGQNPNLFLACKLLRDTRHKYALTATASRRNNDINYLLQLSRFVSIDILEDRDCLFPVNDWSTLSSLLSLQSLRCSECNGITNLSSLSSLLSLQTLDCSYCQGITDLSPLSSLSYLQNYFALNAEASPTYYRCPTSSPFTLWTAVNVMASLIYRQCPASAPFGPWHALNAKASLIYRHCPASPPFRL